MFGVWGLLNELSKFKRTMTALQRPVIVTKGILLGLYCILTHYVPLRNVRLEKTERRSVSVVAHHL